MKLKIFLNSLFLLASCKFAFASFHDLEGIYHIQQVDEYDQSMNEFKTNPVAFQNPLAEVVFVHHFTFIELKRNHEYTYGIDVALMLAKMHELYPPFPKVSFENNAPSKQIFASGKWSMDGDKIMFKSENQEKYRPSRLYSIQLENQDGENYTGSAHINTDDVSVKLVKY